MNRSFAIGDIHGCSLTFRSLLYETLHIAPGDVLYLLGDYIDRGPDSKGVVDEILTLRAGGIVVHTLRGNHEEMMLESENSETDFRLWMWNGGETTLKSFGISSYNELSEEYKDFFAGTRYYITTEDYILVHAGLNLYDDDPFADTYNMVWQRGYTHDTIRLGEYTLIHGHTPLSLHYILQQASKKVINLDGGCVFGGSDTYGYLVAFDMQQRSFHYLQNLD